MSEEGPAGPDALLEAVGRTAALLSKSARRPLRRISVRSGNTSVEVEWCEAAQPAALPPGAYEPAPNGAGTGQEDGQEAGQDDGQGDAGLRYVCSPMVGTFYIAPEPGAKPFVVEGDVVEPGQQVGILEAMKLMNAIEADYAGRVAEILVPDATPVEYGERLVALAPLGEL